MNKHVDLLPLDALVVQLGASTQIGTSIGEQVMWTYAAYEILANLHKNKSISDTASNQITGHGSNFIRAITFITAQADAKNRKISSS